MLLLPSLRLARYAGTENPRADDTVDIRPVDTGDGPLRGFTFSAITGLMYPDEGGPVCGPVGLSRWIEYDAPAV
ncbi:hypothetical protein GCM10027290_01600 [Micromonospora sonneratiae]